MSGQVYLLCEECSEIVAAQHYSTHMRNAHGRHGLIVGPADETRRGVPGPVEERGMAAAMRAMETGARERRDQMVEKRTPSAWFIQGGARPLIGIALSVETRFGDNENVYHLTITDAQALLGQIETALEQEYMRNPDVGKAVGL
jgi:hypothetical protein